MRLSHLKIHQVLCGLAVAVALAIVPLPALADETSPSTTSTTQTPSQSVTEPTPTVTPEPTTQPDASSVLSTPAITLPDSQTTATPIIQVSDMPATLAITNTVDSGAVSGNATVDHNEKAGDAVSGGATATATVLNVANANGARAGDFTTFQCDIDGELQDNLVIDPTSLLPICKSTTIGSGQQTTGQQHLQTGSGLVDILNNIVLGATSGDASVADNERAGSATSGDAVAMANILNIANSNITAKNSFMGVINIYGTLKGNILVPQSLVDGLASSHPASTLGTTAITNNTDASATSGGALVAGNENAGNATSGNAATAITVYNLTGREVVAKNSLLVFVNILGQWSGLIVPAPGSTSALMGSGIQSGNNTSNSHVTGDSAATITNNVSLAAQSGSATVTGNETAGNATSGKAQAGATLVNITDSGFWLDDWFGALFINVLGSWLGNFDIQSAVSNDTGIPPQVISDIQVYQFSNSTSITPATSTVSSSNAKTYPANISDVSQPAGTVLSSSASKHATLTSNDQANRAIKLDIVALVAIILALTLLLATITMASRRWHASN